MQLETRNATDGNYTADMMIVTVDWGGIEAKEVPKAKLLLDFGEHGREFVSSELGLRLLQVLSNSSSLEKFVGTGDASQKLHAILSHTVLKIVPMENENGRDLVEKGDFCFRKNGRGVDNNRNWGIDWGKREKDYLPYEEYPGTHPFSEPEVQLLLNLTKELRPHVWLNVHSGMEALFTPFDHKAGVPEGPEAQASIDMLQDINKLIFNGRCSVGSGGKEVGYLAHGTATDYMYLGLKVPIAMTWEIYGDQKASYNDCFRMFNPLTKQSLEEVLTNWVNAILQLLLRLPDHPSMSELASALKGSGSDSANGGTDATPSAHTDTSHTIDTAAAEPPKPAAGGSHPDADATTTPASDATTTAAGQAAAGSHSRREGPNDAPNDAQAVEEIMDNDGGAPSQLLQGAKLAGVWMLTTVLVGLVALAALLARYRRQTRKKALVLYRTLPQ